MTSTTMRKAYSLPAEWSKQSGIQLTWPHAQTDWLPYLDEITDTFIEMVRVFSKYERVLIVTPHEADVKATIVNKLGIDTLNNIIFHQCPTNDTWARDHGAITMTAENASPTLLDFKFNGWGEKFPASLDNAINASLYENGLLDGMMENHNDFVLEGGSIESDGKGTVFTTSQCLMASHRNQPLTQEEVGNKLKETLNAQQIVWLDYGNLIGDDTDGHIDTIVRTAPDDTLLYIKCDNKDDEQYEDFAALEKQLKDLRKLDGTPYRLMALPFTDAIYDEGERLPATYANFVIINGAVVCPTYDQPDNDAEAMKVLGEAFPNRDIIGIDARTVIRQHGSLHCLTMQYPEGTIK